MHPLFTIWCPFIRLSWPGKIRLKWKSIKWKRKFRNNLKYDIPSFFAVFAISNYALDIGEARRSIMLPTRSPSELEDSNAIDDLLPCYATSTFWAGTVRLGTTIYDRSIWCFFFCFLFCHIFSSLLYYLILPITYYNLLQGSIK